VRKQDRILSRGRHEKNKPRVSQEVLSSAIHNLIKEHKVSFLGHDSPPRSLVLYKAFIRLAPALAIAYGQPVNLHGFGTFKVIKNKKGKRRLKFKVSSEISKYLDTFSDLIDLYPSKICAENVLLDLLNIGKSKDSSLEEASYEH